MNIIEEKTLEENNGEKERIQEAWWVSELPPWKITQMESSTLTFQHSNSDIKRHSVGGLSGFQALAQLKQPKHIITGDQQDAKMGYIGEKKRPMRIDDGSNTSLIAHIQGPFEKSVWMWDSNVSVSDTES